MKQVFVWKSYGDIDVYSLETSQQCEKIVEKLLRVAESWLYTEEYNDVVEYVGSIKSSLVSVKQWKGLINYLLHNCNLVKCDLNSFEAGTDVYDVKG